MIAISSRLTGGVWFSLALALAPSSLCGQAAWKKLAIASPSSRYNHRMVLAKNQVVLFGGVGPSQAETWIYTMGAWVRRPSRTTPPRRTDFGMAYDRKRDRVVVFGGYDLANNKYLDDTWEWDGTTWTEVRGSVRPSARCGLHLAYDGARERVVLFGGYDGMNLYEDTWLYTSSGWQRQTTAVRPPRRCCGQLVEDRSRGQLFLFGGAKSIGSPGTDYDDSWVYTGSNWSSVSPANKPRARRNFGMAYDESRNLVVLFGGGVGQSGIPRLGDTWEWDGNNWSQRGSSPSPTNRLSTLSSRPGGGILLYGGLDPVNPQGDTWEFRSADAATFTRYGSPCTNRTGPVLDEGPISKAWIGNPFEARVRSLGAATAAFVVLGISNSTWAGQSLPLNLGSIGMTGCVLRASAETFNPVTIQNGLATLSFTIPNNPWLLGKEFFIQGGAVESGANPLGVVVSDAAKLVIGSR